VLFQLGPILAVIPENRVRRRHIDVHFAAHFLARFLGRPSQRIAFHPGRAQQQGRRQEYEKTLQVSRSRFWSSPWTVRNCSNYTQFTWRRIVSVHFIDTGVSNESPDLTEECR